MSLDLVLVSVRLSAFTILKNTDELLSVNYALIGERLTELPGSHQTSVELITTQPTLVSTENENLQKPF